MKLRLAPRVAYRNNNLSPYAVARLSAVAARDNVALEVRFCARTVLGRSWAVREEEFRLPWRFDRRLADGRSAEPARTVDGHLEADPMRDILPGLLHYGDAISMAHSIEGRLPFLEYRLVEFASSLPDEFKVGTGGTKRILRDHRPAVGLPMVANRRVKQGYPTPADAWLRAGSGAALKAYLSSPNAEIRAHCVPKELERLTDHHSAGCGGAGNHLYWHLAIELRRRDCIAGRPT